MSKDDEKVGEALVKVTEVLERLTAEPEPDNAAIVLERHRPPEQLVSVTVTKFGDGQVSTGQHVAGEGDIYAKRGDKLMVSRSIASSLEARGLAEMD